MKGLSLLVIVASISFIAGAGLTYVAKTPWSSDMANQASIKPQEGPMLPPQGSVATDMVGGAGASAGSPSVSQGGHQEMGHQHGATTAGGHQHPAGAAKHDHGPAGNAQGAGHQHGTSGAGDHRHDAAGAKHDHGAKSASPTTMKGSQPLPDDLMGSAGTGPGKTIQAPAGQQKAGDKSTGAHDHSSQKTTQPQAKGSQQNHGAHTHTGGAAHDHNAMGSKGHQHGAGAGSAEKHSHGSGKPEKTKSKGSPAAHKHGAGEAEGHSHAAGDGHAGGDMHSQAQVVNPIKPTETSVKKGQQLFNIYCSVCHGTEGRGGMPMESKIPGIPKFTPELLRGVDDSHMFSMVTSGHGPMPGYAEALTPEERWHVTNYVRTLPDKLAAQNKAPVAQRGSR